MYTVLYDGSFEGWLCAVFDVYDYKLKDVAVCKESSFQGNIFDAVHTVHYDEQHSKRVWKGLEQRLSGVALKQLYRAFLSETEGIETVLLQYVQYAFSASTRIESDFSHPAVLTVIGTAQKVSKEKHRMEGFVRFQKTKDDLYYAIIEPEHNVLPLIAAHFAARYADQKWMIYDGRRKYGIHYDLHTVTNVAISFSEDVGNGKDISSAYDEQEEMFQQLWQQYFKSVNIASRKNTKLQIQYMPRRYWKHLTEKKKL